MSDSTGGTGRPKADVQGGEFLPVKVTDQELASLADIGKTRQELEAIRSEINCVGEEPLAVAARLMQENQILGLGEMHWTPNGHRDFGSAVMPVLKGAGATHLALEIDWWVQPVLDEFMRSGSLSRDALPCLLRDDDYVAMLEAARRAGLKLVAVDNRPYRTVDGKPGALAEHRATARASDEQKRLYGDDYMAAAIAGILDADTSAKVVFWVGAMHLIDCRGELPCYSAATLLREKYRICTVQNQARCHSGSTLVRLTENINQPVAISMSRASRTSQLSDFPFGPDEWELVHRYGYWDYIFTYPT